MRGQAVPLRSACAAVLATRNVQAFLRMLRVGEGTADADGYRRLFGGELVDDLADHPRRPVRARLGGGGQITSTAAGAYQFLQRTWDECSAALELPDFSPASQDLAAVFLVRRRGALDDVVAGRLEAAIARCAHEWASLPGSPYGQPTRTLAQATASYLEYGGELAGGGATAVAGAGDAPVPPPVATAPPPRPRRPVPEGGEAWPSAAAGSFGGVSETGAAPVAAASAAGAREAPQALGGGPVAGAAAATPPPRAEKLRWPFPRSIHAGGGAAQSAGGAGDAPPPGDAVLHAAAAQAAADARAAGLSGAPELAAAIAAMGAAAAGGALPHQPIPLTEPAAMPLLAPFLAAALPTLIQEAPALIRIFGSGSRVSERNAAAAERVAAIAMQATQQPTVQGAVQAIHDDPQAAARYRETVHASLGELFGLMMQAHEADEASRDSAMDRNLELGRATGGRWLWLLGGVALLIVLFSFGITVGVLFSTATSFSDETKALLLGQIVIFGFATVLAFLFGSNFQNRLDAAQGRRGDVRRE